MTFTAGQKLRAVATGAVVEVLSCAEGVCQVRCVTAGQTILQEGETYPMNAQILADTSFRTA